LPNVNSILYKQAVESRIKRINLDKKSKNLTGKMGVINVEDKLIADLSKNITTTKSGSEDKKEDSNIVTDTVKELTKGFVSGVSKLTDFLGITSTDTPKKTSKTIQITKRH
jgi:hypothetical protein